MRVTYKNPGLNHSVESILFFQTDGAQPYWSDALFYFYPDIRKEELSKRSPKEKEAYLIEGLTAVYRQLQPEWEEKINAYNEYFVRYEGQINDALSDAFQTDVRGMFNDLTGYLCLNPVCPRFLRERYFDVFHKNSERGALGVSIHEMIHYIWFDAWNKLFHDSYDEYENPSLQWILSEMVVESIMADERLKTINPYFPRDHGGCVYPYFQDMAVDGAPILETLDALYKSNGMENFMKLSYAYCQRHESAIRSHIAEAEKTF